MVMYNLESIQDTKTSTAYEMDTIVLDHKGRRQRKLITIGQFFQGDIIRLKISCNYWTSLQLYLEQQGNNMCSVRTHEMKTLAAPNQEGAPIRVSLLGKMHPS